MNNNDIIYQQQQEQNEKKPSLIEQLCSCIYFFRKKNVKINERYQLGIDTPKSHTRKVCVLDLDETLVHSQFKAEDGYDFLLNVFVQSQLFKVFVTVRPGVEAFIESLSEYFDVVLWTASLKEYADPVMDIIDPQKRIQTRLYRESCTPIKGGLTKNLKKLGRSLKDVIIIDNSQMSFLFQPENGFLIKDFISDKEDKELDLLLPFLIWLSQQSDVRPVSQLYQQYLLNNLNPRKSSKKSILSQSMVLNQDNILKSLQIPRTHTLNHHDFEDIELRQEAGLNSPHVELKMQDQTDDESKETIEISSN
ncbi:unnamed protein product (macronuclear) [Paramecium tetraurelia]|uniref:FCP1 homology domain-containing protein n=1 Tax=Paramecium tetraurelia TaxID=5888 RepID=A0CPX5_PARTE|nr:uncharacterized protein GSPATT00009234001 [Paramecium tetraurelia]CAK72842.1 unnamed protein product [Paramecium tetraurelia]|eukprot:XP_001440239.1 hypothetical protein (macronuclear) [Paramecium tetraurelia strain d4-2]